MALRPNEPWIRWVRASRWRFASETARAAAVRGAGEQASTAGGMVLEDADEPALLGLIWSARAGRAEEPVPWPPALDAGDVVWTAEAEIVARWRSPSPGEAPGCLVVVRQPLRRPDREAQRDWVSTVLRALEGEPAPPQGLLTANFFATRDGSFVLNFAEWTSPAAHREALKRGSYGQHGSIGSSALWRATREHPAITLEHEVHRYVPLATNPDAGASDTP